MACIFNADKDLGIAGEALAPNMQNDARLADKQYAVRPSLFAFF